MISKITRGSYVTGLVEYLWGPGEKDEHSNPKVIASSHGSQWFEEVVAPDTAELAQYESALAAFKRGDLIEEPEAPRFNTERGAAALSYWLDRLDVRPPKHVWHCSLRVADHESLSESQWAEVAASAVAAVGISEAQGDANGCEWVAMSHDGEDGRHIHIAAVLVRPDGSKAHPWKDFEKVGEVCRSYESEWGLERTAERNGNAHHAETQYERHGHKVEGALEKADVRRLALQAAAEVTCWEEYRERLEQQGVTVTPRYSTIMPGQITGYRLEVPATGLAVAGGKLGRGLSYNQLTEGWTGLEHGPATADELRRLRQPRRDEGQGEVAHALQGAALSPESPDSALALGTVLQLGSRYHPELVAVAENWERARYWNGSRIVRTHSGRAVRRAVRHMERGQYEAALLAAMIEVAIATAQVLARNVAYRSQYMAASRAVEGMQQLHKEVQQRERQARLHSAEHEPDLQPTSTAVDVADDRRGRPRR